MPDKKFKCKYLKNRKSFFLLESMLRVWQKCYLTLANWPNLENLMPRLENQKLPWKLEEFSKYIPALHMCSI